MRTTISLLLLVAVHAAAQSGAPPQLSRRGSAGVAVAAEESQVIVRGVLPGLPAAKAGLQGGDVLLKLDDVAVASVGDFVSRIGSKKPGDTARVEYSRNGQTATATITIEERPREQSEVYDVAYGAVTDGTYRYRTISTKPKNAAPVATLFLVQGLGCGSIDNPPPGHSYRKLIESLTRRGFATLRVDKPGTGDSEGGPCSAVDFHGEVKAYRAALESLKNEKNVFLLGHSMGGIQAPLIAAGFPVRGVIVYGATYNSWGNYIVANTRRQQRLRGESFETIAETEKRNEAFNALFYVQKQPLEKILAEHPEFRAMFPDGKTLTAGKEGKYFQQLYDVDLAKAWKALNTPVLALYGGSDFLTDASEHEWLAAAINSWRPGTAKFVKLDGVDHWLLKTADQAASLRQAGEGEYDDRFGETVAAFMNEQLTPRPAAPPAP